MQHPKRITEVLRAVVQGDIVGRGSMDPPIAVPPEVSPRDVDRSRRVDTVQQPEVRRHEPGPPSTAAAEIEALRRRVEFEQSEIAVEQLLSFVLRQARLIEQSPFVSEAFNRGAV